MASMLTPVLALIVLSLLVWIWMYATRIPAIQRAGIDPQNAAPSWIARRSCRHRCGRWPTITIT